MRQNLARSLDDINRDTGMHFTQEQVNTITNICRDAVTPYSKNTLQEKLSSRLADFINRYKKGSKIFKNIMVIEKTEYIQVLKNTQKFGLHHRP